MIKNIKTAPLNVINNLSYRCEKCKQEGQISLENYTVSLDYEGNVVESLFEYKCPICGEKL